MNRLPALMSMLSLVIAACSTENVPLFGLDKPPDGSLFLHGDANLQLEAIMQVDSPQTFRFRFNGQFGVVELSSGPGPYDYLAVDVQEWVARTIDYAAVPHGTYVVEMVDASGVTWGQTPPIDVQAPTTTGQIPAVIFTHLDGHDATWVLDPTTQDADPATMETTVSNLSPDDVTVKRCQQPGAVSGNQGCTSLGTAPAGGDFQTVETVTTNSAAATSPALVVGPYQRQLVKSAPGSCQIERIVVTGMRTLRDGTSPAFAMSACNGY